MDDFIKLKSKDLRHGKIHKYEEVIKHKNDHKITNISLNLRPEMDYTQPSRGGGKRAAFCHSDSTAFGLFSVVGGT